MDLDTASALAILQEEVLHESPKKEGRRSEAISYPRSTVRLALTGPVNTQRASSVTQSSEDRRMVTPGNSTRS